MTTFSQLVDSMVVELQRPDRLELVVNSLNQVIREIHTMPGGGSNTLYDANRYEEQFILTGSSPHLWSLPSATRFQRLDAVFSERNGDYVTERKPRVSRGFDAPRAFWYRSGPQIAFGGLYEGDVLGLSYFMFPRRLAYQPLESRQVTYDSSTDEYKTPAGGEPTESQMDAATHWVLQRWPDVLAQGIRAAVYRANGDTDRSRTAYSAFEQARLGLWQQEPKTTFE